jgi:hypothetical protein
MTVYALTKLNYARILLNLIVVKWIPTRFGAKTVGWDRIWTRP